METPREPLKINNSVTLLVLRHPQEAKQAMGTGALTVHALTRARIRTGLSWPNLTKAVGAAADPKHWAVLYLGAAKDLPKNIAGPVVAVDRDGAPLADQTAALKGITGIILLDGTWSQSKTLWWRNPWLLKLRRLILLPDRRSLYGGLRKEPRKVSISTIEAVGLCLSHLEDNPGLREGLDQVFLTFLNEFQEIRK